MTKTNYITISFLSIFQYKTDAQQDVKKMEKFVNNLMRHMASKETN